MIFYMVGNNLICSRIMAHLRKRSLVKNFNAGQVNVPRIDSGSQLSPIGIKTITAYIQRFLLHSYPSLV